MHYSKHISHLAGTALALLACAACGGQPAASTALPAPSPTIAAVVIPPTAEQAATQPVAAATAAPTNTPPPEQAAGTPAAEPTIYLWPSYLPAGLTPAPKESRVSGENELGDAELGFYLITLNGEGKKLAIGGGGLREALPLAGERRALTVGGRAATLISSGDQRELIFEVSRGKLFVYSVGLSEEELLRVGESLQPIDVRTLRELIAPS